MPPQQADVERGRWFLTGCSTLFALPFFVAGVSLMRSGFHALHQHQPDAWVPLGGGAIFAVVSIGIVAMIWFATRRASAGMQRRAMYPAQPWLWRPDWAAQRVEEPPAAGGAAILIFAIIWNVITVPTALTMLRVATQQPLILLFAAIFPLAGLALLAAAIYTILQRTRFGRSQCLLERVPVPPGSALRGTIEHRGSVPEAGYDLVLRCVNRVITGGGRSRTVTEDVLWESQQHVSPAIAAPTPAGMRVPFTFEIPADAASTDLRDSTSSTIWRLVATAVMPGVDYKATFELPVFATSGDAAAYHVVHLAAAAQRELGPDSRVSETPLPSGGSEFRIAPQRDAGGVTAILVIGIFWWGTVALMWRLHAPQFITIIFALFGLVIVLMAVDYLLGRSSIRADANGLRVRREWLGAGSTTTIANADVDSVAPKVAGRSGSRPYYDVEARLKRGTATTVARYFRSRDDAETLAAKVWAALGRQQSSGS